MKTKNTNARSKQKRDAGVRSVPLLIKGLQPLRAASDQHIWAVLNLMKRSGQMRGSLPDYEDVYYELVKSGFPGYDNKQISKSIGRLRTMGYIREMVELAA
jgi:hypothetical protein